METTRYFDYTRLRSDRASIKMEWIVRTIEHPVHTKVQSDGRIRKQTKIEEAGKYLRVVLLPDGETIHNAFFDRDFSGT